MLFHLSQRQSPRQVRPSEGRKKQKSRVQRELAFAALFVSWKLDVGLISPFGPREARPKWGKFVPRASRAERIFALVEFTLSQVFFCVELNLATALIS
jgi:hypothetical protein